MGLKASNQKNLVDYPRKISIEIRKKKLKRKLIFSRITDDFIIYDALLGNKLCNLYIQTEPKKRRTVLYYDNDRDCWFTTAIHNVSTKPKNPDLLVNNNDINNDNKRVLYLKTNKPKIITLINPNNIISTDNGITTMKDLIELYTRDNYKKWSSKTLHCMYIVRKVKDIPNQKESLVNN